MKYLFNYCFGMCLLMSCGHNDFCKSCRNLIKHVDESKAYKIESEYCIKRISDTVLANDTGIISFTAFHRINGNRYKNGDPVIVMFFKMDSMNKIHPDDSTQKITCITDTCFGYQKLPPGAYTITVSTVYSWLTRKKVNLGKNKVIDMNLFMGTSAIE